MISLPALPILIPFGTASLCLISLKRPRLQRLAAVLGAVAHLICALALLTATCRQGYLVLQAGDWPAPFGISLVADLFSSLMITLAAITGTAITFYALAGIDSGRESFGFYPFLHLLLMGVCGCFLAGDLFNLYVWFEVMLMASFILLALGGERGQLEGGVKYVILNLVASAFFLTALGILYGLVGTLNMADIARHLQTAEQSGLVSALAMLFLVAFGIKAALFPLFSWLPASYHTPPVAVSAVFAGLLTKVGVYALVRAFTLLFIRDISFTHELILVLAAMTMLTGVLGAVCQDGFRRILSFHIISQVGYMIMGLGIFTPLALAGTVFYIVHHIIVKTNLFLVSGVAHKLRSTEDLNRLGGFLSTAPFLSILFLIPALSLAGLPPLSGFWAKFFLIWASFEEKRYLIGALGLLVGALTLISMTKIWLKAFWGTVPAAHPERHAHQKKLPPGKTALFYLPMISLALLTLTIGLWPGLLFELAQQAASQLLDPNRYIQAVLGVTL
ncbi:MAG: multicomponent Na+:H+ antiporter subunit [Desulfuromonadales bacterium]|jgi:multicomponent Na+:H+ antiporter subunit D|nr:multicomponent Na+:H+ antiporter subunit [Desulfuromonadales bacterium]